MSDNGVREGRFGWRRQERGPSEVETRLEASEVRAQVAETRVSDLQAELMFYGEQMRAMKTDLESMPERVASQVTHPALAEIEEKMLENQAIRAELDSALADLQAEVSTIVGWRQEVEAAIGLLAREIESARSTIDIMPQRIREALTPAAEAVSRVDARLVELTSISVLPGSARDWGPISGQDHVEGEPAQPEWQGPPEYGDPNGWGLDHAVDSFGRPGDGQ